MCYTGLEGVKYQTNRVLVIHPIIIHLYTPIALSLDLTNFANNTNKILLVIVEIWPKILTLTMSFLGD